MRIHEVLENETLTDIAKKYGIFEEDLRKLNGIYDEECTAGEELLIITPTRTHTAKHGDTIERLCLRYRVRKNDLLALNPTIKCNRLEVGQRVALKYDERTHGMAATNGCIYKGTSLSELEESLPYMTYATFSSVCADKTGFKRIFDEGELLERVKKENKIPLLKIYDSYSERYEKGDVDGFCKNIIELAKNRGYKGITLNSTAHNASAENYSRFLIDLKKSMIGEDLILITECDENSPKEYSDIGDGAVFSYSKLWCEPMPSFADGERRAITDFACDAESIKSFIELSAFARLGDGSIEIENAKKMARKEKSLVSHDKSARTLFFDSAKGKCTYPSLQNIKAVLELLSEYGFMGISFDVSRTPSVYLAMYNAMFKTIGYGGITSAEGCNRGCAR